MSIRTRLLVLLLTLALLPVALLGSFTLRSLDALGERVGAEAHEALLDGALARLRTKVADAVVIYGRQTEALEHLVGDQALLAEAALAAPGSGRALHYGGDFDAGRIATTRSELHQRPSEAGGAEPIAVSFDVVALHLAPGALRETLAADASRLAGLAPAYARLAQLDELGVVWHYTSLESGLHSAYPGHGGYPESFDARERPWYREAMEKEGPIWSVPFVDVATRTVVSSVAQAIRGPGGGLPA